MSDRDRPTSLRGQLLIAEPQLEDPNFGRTVILIAEHSDQGAMGVVLNRPSDSHVGDVVPDLSDLVEPGDSVFVGGPVQPEAVVALAEFEDAERAAILVAGDLGFLGAEDMDPPIDVATRRVKVFAGYSGWGPGQLEEELETGSWWTHPADPEDVFTDDPDHLWSAVLRRKGGKFAMVALMPEDPSVN